MASRRFNLPISGLTVATDLSWLTAINVSTRGTYKAEFESHIRKNSTTGVLVEVAPKSYVMGCVQDNADLKLNTHYSLAASVVGYLNDKYSTTQPTIHILQLNDDLIYLIGTEGKRIFFDVTIQSEINDTTDQKLESVCNSVLDHKLIFNKPWSIASYLDSDFKSQVKNQVTSRIDDLIEIEVSTESMDQILKEMPKKNLVALKDVQNYNKVDYKKIIAVISVVLMVGSTIGYNNYTEKLKQEERERLEREAIERANQLTLASKKKTPTIQTNPFESFKIEETRLLEQGERWLKHLSSVNNVKLSNELSEIVKSQYAVVNNWELDNILVTTNLNWNDHNTQIKGIAIYKKAEVHATAQDIVDAFPDINLNVNGQSATKHFSKSSDLKTQVNTPLKESDFLANALTLITKGKQNKLITEGTVTEDPNPRPLPISEHFLDQIRQLPEANKYSSITENTWLTPIKKFRMILTGNSLNILEFVNNMSLNSGTTLLNGLTYKKETQQVQVELISYAFEE